MIDNFAVLAMDPAQAKLAFQVLSERYEYRRATMITTNLLCGAPHKRFNAERIVMRS